MKQTLLAGLPGLGLTLTETQVDTLCRFGELLLEKNKVMNLTAIRDPAETATLHFLDSLTLLNVCEFAGKRVIDVGCGAGFPGVPLAVAEPTMALTLLDSLGKRMAWLRETLPTLGVTAEVATARAEAYAADHREAFDICVSRAVARLDVLAELCLPLVKPGGLFLAMKGARADEELAAAQNALKTLGGAAEQTLLFRVGQAEHAVIPIRKVRATPAQFPRAFAKIKQKPL